MGASPPDFERYLNAVREDIEDRRVRIQISSLCEPCGADPSQFYRVLEQRKPEGPRYLSGDRSAVVGQERLDITDKPELYRVWVERSDERTQLAVEVSPQSNLDIKCIWAEDADGVEVGRQTWPRASTFARVNGPHVAAASIGEPWDLIVRLAVQTSTTVYWTSVHVIWEGAS